MSPEDETARRARQNSACAVVIIVILLTVIAAPVLVISGLVFEHDRQSLDAFNAAPVCAAGTPVTVSCKQAAEYRVASKYGQGGHNATFYLYLLDASGTQTRVQLTSDGGVWPTVTDGEEVTVTSWHGTPVSVSDGRGNASTLIDSPITDGGTPYQMFWIVGSICMYVILFAMFTRAAAMLLLAPTATAITGALLYGKIIGGNPLSDVFLELFAAWLLLLFAAAAAAKRRHAPSS